MAEDTRVCLSAPIGVPGRTLTGTPGPPSQGGSVGSYARRARAHPGNSRRITLLTVKARTTPVMNSAVGAQFDHKLSVCASFINGALHRALDGVQRTWLRHRPS